MLKLFLLILCFATCSMNALAEERQRINQDIYQQQEQEYINPYRYANQQQEYQEQGNSQMQNSQMPNSQMPNNYGPYEEERVKQSQNEYVPYTQSQDLDPKYDSSLFNEYDFDGLAEGGKKDRNIEENQVYETVSTTDNGRTYLAAEYSQPFLSSYNAKMPETDAYGLASYISQQQVTNTSAVPFADQKIDLYLGVGYRPKMAFHSLRFELGFDYTFLLMKGDEAESTYTNGTTKTSKNIGDRAFHIAMPEARIFIDLNSPESRFSIYIGGFTGYGVINKIYGSSSNIVTSIKYGVTAGTTIRMSTKADLYLAYKFTTIPEKEFSIETDTQTITGLTYHSATVGIRLHR